MCGSVLSLYPTMMTCGRGILKSVVCSHFLVYTLASTNINQSAPNLVQMYMTIRSQINWIMELIGPKLSELSALELEICNI